MKYQQYNDAIYQMRQEILKDIREYASRLMQKSNGVLITNASAPIVTFETDEKVWPHGEDVGEYQARPWMRVCRPKFEVRKTSRCLMRYEAEKDDEKYLNKLHIEMNRALKAMENKLGTRDDYQRAFNAWVDACRIYDKAIANQECACENMYYIETADETNRGCQALYRIDDGISQCDKPCKIGEPIVNKIW